MGKYERENRQSTDGTTKFVSFTNTNSNTSSITRKCANRTAACVAASAAYTAIILPYSTTITTNATTVAKLGANATRNDGDFTTGKDRSTGKNLGQCITKRGWWSR
jgi:hypothetical protein